jgi:uncharacterized membrane protein YtjA (UPF0391 family)
MLYWAAVFLILALLAAVLGFGGLAGTLSWAAQLLFVVFVILMIVAGIARAVQGQTP